MKIKDALAAAGGRAVLGILFRRGKVKDRLREAVEETAAEVVDHTVEKLANIPDVRIDSAKE